MSETAARRLVYQRSNGVCEACGEARATEWHHRKNRSQGGKWSPANGLHLCHDCHSWITTHPEEAHERGWVVWRAEDPLQVPTDLAAWGDAILDDLGCFTLSFSADTMSGGS